MHQPLRRLLITGATGKQGGAVISALLQKPGTSPFHLIALTRNPKSAKAAQLAKNPNVSILEGDLNNCDAIFKSAAAQGPIHGVFSVQVPLRPKVEEAQGKALVDSAAKHGVKHFIYTSADRGGPERSDADGTKIAHFRSKFNIEKHLKAVAARTPGMKWTIIRPVAFMENLTDDFLGKAFQTMWELNGLESKLQLVSSVDIGLMGADAFRNPTEYQDRAISFATDELTAAEAREVFGRVVGREIPTTYPILARTIKTLLREQLGDMFDWFKSDGFGADPAAMRARFPDAQNFEAWLRRSSAWKQEIERRATPA
jgi:uncharacterized protein YbjT (DUF2867 family)